MDHELELLDKILSSRSSSYCPPSTSKKATIFTRKLAFEEGISGDTLLIKQFAAAKCVQHTRNILADVKVGNFNSTFKTLFYAMNGSGSRNLDHFFARFHDLIGERNHFFLRERERELNHFLRELPIPCYFAKR